MKKQQIAALTLARAVTAKDAKAAADALKEGYNKRVLVTASIDARVTRAKGTEALPTASLLSEALVAELVRRLGVTAEAFKRHLRDIAYEALVLKQPVSEKIVAEHPELLQIMADIKSGVINLLPKQQRAGAIKVVAGIDYRSIEVK